MPGRGAGQAPVVVNVVAAVALGGIEASTFVVGEASVEALDPLDPLGAHVIDGAADVLHADTAAANASNAMIGVPDARVGNGIDGACVLRVCQ